MGDLVTLVEFCPKAMVYETSDSTDLLSVTSSEDVAQWAYLYRTWGHARGVVISGVWRWQPIEDVDNDMRDYVKRLYAYK